MNLDLSHLNAKLVLPAPYQSIEFWLVGAGGTGSFMAMNLARLAFELKTLGRPPARIVIVDPDRVEIENIPRSNFCFAEIGLNKAETLAGRIARAWGIEVGFVREGFRPSLLLESATGDRRSQSSDSNRLTVLIGCVDNHLARRQIHEALKFHSERGTSSGSSLPRVWWIDGGNGRDTGQVLIGNCFNEKKICESARTLPILSLLPAPSLQHHDLLEREGEKPVRSNSSSRQPAAGDRHPTCAERIRLGEQSLNINSRVAVEMSEMLTALLLTNSLKRFASYFDLETGTSRSSFATPDKIEQAVNSAAKNDDVSKMRKRTQTNK